MKNVVIPKWLEWPLLLICTALYICIAGAMVFGAHALLSLVRNI